MNVLEAVGGGVNRGLAYIGGLTIQFWGRLCASPRALPIIGKRGRWRAALQEMRVIGVDALPMVGIMSVCTGFILAMQAGAELRRFGALQYVMDTVAIGFTRELGPLLTAFVVSGRSGSAFSAEIGTMVVTSEIDALRNAETRDRNHGGYVFRGEYELDRIERHGRSSLVRWPGRPERRRRLWLPCS